MSRSDKHTKPAEIYWFEFGHCAAAAAAAAARRHPECVDDDDDDANAYITPNPLQFRGPVEFRIPRSYNATYTLLGSWK